MARRFLAAGFLDQTLLGQTLLGQSVLDHHGFAGLLMRRKILGSLLLAGDRLGAHRIARAVGARAAVPVAAAAAPAGAMIGVVVGGARVALFLRDQRLPVGDRDLVVVGVDFGERQEAVAVAAVIDERRLQRRFDPRDLGEVDVAAKLLAVSGLEVEFFDAVAA